MDKRQFGRRGPEQQAKSSNSFRANSAYTSSNPTTGQSGLSVGDFDALDYHHGSSDAGSMGILSLLFSFSGRIDRGTYWMIGIPRFFIMIGAVIVLARMAANAFGNVEFVSFLSVMYGTIGGLICTAIFIATVVCVWSLEARRIHDRGHSALWLMLFFIPIVGHVYGLYLFVANGFFAGTPGRNEFG